MENNEELLELIRQAQSGQRPAMDRLLEMVRPHLEWVAAQVADPRCATESVSDLVQEAAARVWQKLDQFKGPADPAETGVVFRDWAARIVQNIGVDKHRERNAQRRNPETPILHLDPAAGGDSSSQAAAMDPAGSTPTPSAIAQTGERAQLVRAAVASIVDETARTIVELRFVENLSLRQISERLGLSYDKTREKFDAALSVLERELKDLI